MPRKVNVVTTCRYCQEVRDATYEGNLAWVEEILNTAGSLKPDLLLLPETVIDAGITGKLKSEEYADRLCKLLSDKAKELNSYIIGGTYIMDGPTKYNVALLYGRDGKLAGKYYKYHVTDYEIRDLGVKPGSDFPVFDTDFGRIGIVICYDIGWPDIWNALAEKGAELVAWISAYDGGLPLQGYARQHLYFVASAVWTEFGKIIDKTGKILKTTVYSQNWTSRVIDLEKEFFHTDYNAKKLATIQKKLGKGIEIEAYPEENTFTMESHDPKWPMSRIISEFELETFKQYHKRAEQVQIEARNRA